MASVKIHGHPFSTCTKRVATVCNELGVKYEIVEVDMVKGAHKTPEYIENFQPFGIIPVLEDSDGTKIYESRAIGRYLTAKYGKDSGLLPPSTDVKAYGLFEQAASIEYSSFDPPASGLTKERVFNPMFKVPTNEVLATHFENSLKTKLEGYERVLAKQKYLAGDHITLADLFHLPYGTFVNQINPELIGSKPNLKRWWDDISSRESWKALN
ncbi:glutathione S-transferase [Ceratobasidium sp. AG-Ba]|nr:glutathione S-transferase [Ceratobasidium sp. AG-Ba]QRW07768.1 glutathione S-transferase [Ceratobasidium sp. AG-Ba]